MDVTLATDDLLVAVYADAIDPLNVAHCFIKRIKLSESQFSRR